MGAAGVHGKTAARDGRTRLPLAQVTLVAAMVLLGLSWGSQRAPATVRPTAPAQYISDLLLPLDVGTLEQQVRRRARRRRPAAGKAGNKTAPAVAAHGHPASCMLQRLLLHWRRA